MRRTRSYTIYNKDDLEKVKLWESKNKKIYSDAIYIWTISDIQKYNKAKRNKLNYRSRSRSNSISFKKPYNKPSTPAVTPNAIIDRESHTNISLTIVLYRNFQIVLFSPVYHWRSQYRLRHRPPCLNL